MITIFCDFRPFSARNGVILKNRSYDQIFALFSFVLNQKRQFFGRFFGENISRIKTSVPGVIGLAP
jgi:hypothetical protein